MQVARQVEIRLRTGEVMTIDVSDKLMEQVMTTFGLPTPGAVTDAHVKYYLASSMRNALETTDGRQAD